MVSLLVDAQKGWTLEGCTALMFSVYSLNVECIRILVKHEAKIQDINGKTALMYCCILKANNQQEKMKQNEIIGMLIQEAGLQDENGWTAFMYACKTLNMEAAKLLVKYEAGYVNHE